MPGPTDSWVTLAGLARETSTIRLGTMVTSATFRHPGPLAISVAQVDATSDGRIDLGIGAGWSEAEHLASGIPFPTLGERFERLAEQLDIITGMWSTPVGDAFDYSGAHYAVNDSPALAAKSASEFNVAHSALAEVKAQFGPVGAAVDAAGRGSDSMTYSVSYPVFTGRDDAEVSRRASVLDPGLGDLHPFVGTPDELVDTVGPFVEAGVQRIYLQLVDLADVDHMVVIAGKVVPQFR